MSGSEQITCSACKAQIPVFGKAMTLTLTCPSCKVYIRRGNWNKAIKRFSESFEPAIPIGSFGKIDGTKYRVMGFVVKKENKYKYYWREYLLFNPYKGYAFLSEYNGHWNFVWPVEDEPRSSRVNDNFYYNHDGSQHYFQIYQKYGAEVVYARGEFFFDVVDITDSTNNVEYISPPFMMAMEQSDDSLLWCMGEYMTRSEVASAFNIQAEMLPAKVGLGYTQPTSTSFSTKTLLRCSIALLLILLAIQFIFSSSASEKEVYHSKLSQFDLKEQKFFVTPSFKLEGGKKSLEIIVTAPVDNDWFFAEISLINDDDGSEYNFTKDIEYYHGYEEGSEWTEGGHEGRAFLSSIPDGNYHLNIYPEFSLLNTQFTVTVYRDVTENLNVVVAAIAIALFPVFYFIRRNYIEKKRWSESDYSPYDEA